MRCSRPLGHCRALVLGRRGHGPGADTRALPLGASRGARRWLIGLGTTHQFWFGRTLRCRGSAFDRCWRIWSTGTAAFTLNWSWARCGRTWAGWLGPRTGSSRTGRRRSWSCRFGLGLADHRFLDRLLRCGLLSCRLLGQRLLGDGLLGSGFLWCRLLRCRRLAWAVRFGRCGWFGRSCRSGGGSLSLTHGEDGFAGSGFARCSRSGLATLLQQGADFCGFPVADGAAVALGRNGQLFSGIEHVLVVQAKVLGQLINSDFAAAGHSGLRSVRARCASGHHPGGANGHLASAAVP